MLLRKSGVMKNTKLYEARVKSGVLQKDVAAAAGLTVRGYQNYETGERIPRADIAILIAKAVNSTVEKLFGEA